MVAVSVFVVVLLAQLTTVISTPKPAIYIDNGFDQTAIDRLMTEEEKQEMEIEILNLLGLPNRPRHGGKGAIKRSAPKFLLDIYERLVAEENDEHSREKRSTDTNFSGVEQKQIETSDVIMTFESVGEFSIIRVCLSENVCFDSHRFARWKLFLVTRYYSDKLKLLKIHNTIYFLLHLYRSSCK